MALEFLVGPKSDPEAERASWVNPDGTPNVLPGADLQKSSATSDDEAVEFLTKGSVGGSTPAAGSPTPQPNGLAALPELMAGKPQRPVDVVVDPATMTQSLRNIEHATGRPMAAIAQDGEQFEKAHYAAQAAAEAAGEQFDYQSFLVAYRDMQKGHVAQGLPNQHVGDVVDADQERRVATTLTPTVQSFHEVDMDVDSEGDEPGDSVSRQNEMVAVDSGEKYVDYWRNEGPGAAEHASQAKKSLAGALDDLDRFFEPENDLQKAYLDNGRVDEWTDAYMGYGDLYLKALQLARENLEHNKARPKYDDQPNPETNPQGYGEYKQRQRDWQKRNDVIRRQKDALEIKLLDAKLERERQHQNMSKSGARFTLDKALITIDKARELAPRKARQILRDGEVNGKPLTDKQRRYFGAVASGSAQKSLEKAGLYVGPRGGQTANDILEDWLEKAGTYGGLPSGDSSSLQKPKSQAQGGSADGGELAGVGETASGIPAAPGPGQDAVGQATGTRGRDGLDGGEKLSADDADDEGQMRPHAKPIEATTRKSTFPADQRGMVRREHAAAVGQVRARLEASVQVPTDVEVADLVKSDGFYHGGDPGLGIPQPQIAATRECHWCQTTIAKSLTACPACDADQVRHRPMPAFVETTHHRQPLLRKARSEGDVQVCEPPGPLLMTSHHGRVVSRVE